MVTGYSDFSPDTIDFMPSYLSNYKLFTFSSRDVYNRDGLKSIYITSAVQAWMQGLENNGIMLKCRNDEGWIKFSSSSNTVNSPSLKIIYSTDTETPNTKGIERSECYYILNKENRKSLFINNYNDVILNDFSQDIYNEWMMIYDSTENGIDYYKIKLLSYNYFLEASINSEDDTYDVFASLINNSDGQKWRIIRNWDGSYKLIPKNSDGTKVLSINSELTDVILETMSVDFNKSDDWSLIKIDKNKSTLYGTCGICQTVNSMDEISFVDNSLTSNGFDCTNMHACDEFLSFWI